ncbi:MAG: helix-turn-helix transcriptional regulator [Oceanobacillus sp.]|nr:helix-turn-helix transcriptional regulator [Oceanobacillus sp.]
MEEVSFEKLWRLLRKNGMKKTDLYTKVGLSTNAIAKMGKGQDVRLNVLVKICKYFNCKFDDIVTIVGN